LNITHVHNTVTAYFSCPGTAFGWASVCGVGDVRKIILTEYFPRFLACWSTLTLSRFSWRPRS